MQALGQNASATEEARRPEPRLHPGQRGVTKDGRIEPSSERLKFVLQRGEKYNVIVPTASWTHVKIISAQASIGNKYENGPCFGPDEDRVIAVGPSGMFLRSCNSADAVIVAYTEVYATITRAALCLKAAGRPASIPAEHGHYSPRRVAPPMYE
jgi:hypothetical protein